MGWKLYAFLMIGAMHDIDKVPIELTPFDALSILTFLLEFEYDHPQLQALKTSIDNFRAEIYLKITNDQIDDAFAERSVNKLLGKDP